MLGFCSFI